MYRHILIWFWSIVAVILVVLQVQVTKFKETVTKTNLFCNIQLDSAINNFQSEESMDVYMDGGSMSSSYNAYINWLGSFPAYSDTARLLREDFSLGANASNFALPYLEEAKLKKLFQENIDRQVAYFNTSENKNLFQVSSVKCTSLDVSYSMRRFSGGQHGDFGLNSSFATNNYGTDMLHDYDLYPSYFITAEIEIVVPMNMKLLVDIRYDMKQKYTLRKTYELYN